MIRRAFLVALALLAAACDGRVPGRVDARDHEAFWLWAGVEPQPMLEQAKTLYVLDGEVRADGYVPLRPQPPRVAGPQLWMVVRTDDLHWSEASYAAVLRRLERWKVGNRLAGVQIDFDARTKYLGEYAAFLSDLRERLPPSVQLSITGLMDWSANGDPAGLAGLSGTVDEVVIQTYQGRETIPGYEAYLAKLKRFPIPFRIGLVQRGAWAEPAGLNTNPNFRGYVVFLLNEKP